MDPTLNENKCIFKIIESDQSCNIFLEEISWTRIKHNRCQQLLCSTNPDGKRQEKKIHC